MHDMWPFTGGCHYDQGCGRYANRCGACPVLGSRTDSDLSRWVWSRKQRSWRRLPMALVAPSAWLAECASSSSLFRGRPVRIIGNPLDTAVFRPIDKACARACLGIDQDRRMILFGGVNPISFSNKGFGILLESMKMARRSWTDIDYELVVFGCSQPTEPLPEELNIRFMGYLNDEISMAILYNAADVLVVPSFQESFCQTAAESLACGTPVVAFDSTGVRDVVDHKINGYLARPYEVEDLTHGMRWVLREGARNELSRHARQKAVEHFSRHKIAGEYAYLYRELLDEGA
jgi:glycosyltransferase involved in cell wall biosynthesis